MIEIQDLIDRFGEEELAERSDRQAYQIIDRQVVQSAIDDAITEIASYLHPTGLIWYDAAGDLHYNNAHHLPKALKIRACDMARYYLYDDDVPNTVKLRYEQALHWLKQVQKTPSMLTGIAPQVAHGTATIAVMPNPKPNLWRE